MRTFVRTLVSVAVAILLVALLLWWSGTEPGEVVASLKRLEPGTYAGALAIHALIYPLRAARFRTLLGGGDAPGVGRLMPVAAAHVLAANVLPAKVGEAALVLYLRRLCGVSGWRGFAVLVVSRLLDLAAMTLVLGVACLSLGAAGVYPDLNWLVPMGLSMLAATLALGLLAARGDRVVGLFSRLVRLARLEGTRAGSGLLGIGQRVREALVEVQGSSLLASAPLSLVIWLCIFAFYAVLARGLGLEALGLAEAAFGTGLAIVAGLLPINGFAGFGPQDAGWVVGFGALGVERDLATSTALAAHLVFLFNVSLFGLAGHVAMGRMRPSTAES